MISSKYLEKRLHGSLGQTTLYYQLPFLIAARLLSLSSACYLTLGNRARFVCEVARASGFAGAREVCYPMSEIFAPTNDDSNIFPWVSSDFPAGVVDKSHEVLLAAHGNEDVLVDRSASSIEFGNTR